MPAPRTISITADGADNLGVHPLWAWQANPLTIVCDLSGITLLDGAAAIAAKIHSTAAPGGTVPLASLDVESDASEVTFDFTTAEMSFSIGSGVSAFCYLFLTALDDDGTELQTLYARRIEIKAAAWSNSHADGVLTFSDSLARFTLDGVNYAFPVASEVSATRGNGRLSVTDGIASFTRNYVTCFFPVASVTATPPASGRLSVTAGVASFTINSVTSSFAVAIV